jgi:hypothetical protein
MREPACLSIVLLASLIAGCGGDTDYTFQIPVPDLAAGCAGNVHVRSLHVRLAESRVTNTHVCSACIPVDPPASSAAGLAEPLLAAGDLCDAFKLKQSFRGVVVIVGYDNGECIEAGKQVCGFAENVEIPVGQDAQLPGVLLHCDPGMIANCR